MQRLVTLLEWLGGILLERELWIGVVAALVTIVVTLLLRLPQRLFNHFVRKTIRVKEIRRRQDPDLQAFLHVYEARIEEALRVSNDDIITWVGGTRAERIRGREDVTLVAKHNGEPIAILKAIVSRPERLAFVAYLATAAAPGRGTEKLGLIGRQGAVALTEWLSRRLKRRDCKAVVFEVATERGPAKLRLFREYATLHGRRCCTIEMGYVVPRMEHPERGSEKRMTLAYVALSESSEALSCSIEEATAILRFIYFTVYLGTYAARHSSDETRQYAKYLEKLFGRQVKSLPTAVRMCKI